MQIERGPDDARETDEELHTQVLSSFLGMAARIQLVPMRASVCKAVLQLADWLQSLTSN